MMDTLLSNFNFWHWFILAMALVIIEMFTVTTYLLWIGLGATLTGVIAWIFPGLTLPIEGIIFALSSLFCIILGSYCIKRHPIRSEQPLLNRRGKQYINRILVLEEAIHNGRGSVRVDDTTWRVTGEDCPKGTSVKVIDTEGVFLVVEKYKDKSE